MDDAYLTETVTWRTPGASTPGDFYGSSVPTDAEIRVRWENRRRTVRDASGSEVVSEALVFTKAPVRTGHALIDSEGREWPVVAVSEQKGLDGRFSHNEVAL
jgi:hypothetical protein